MTLNYGLRMDMGKTSVPEILNLVGRFKPLGGAFPAVDLPRLGPDFNPRLSVAYDLFGNAKTALKFGWNRYVEILAEGFPTRYAPSVTDTDRRDWFDLALNPATGDLYPGCTLGNPTSPACIDPYGGNGDDVAQDWEIGASGDVNFGSAVTDSVDPNIQRAYNDQWMVGVQQEIAPGVSVSATYRRRSDHNTQSADNLLRSFGSFIDTVQVARPAPYVGSFTIFNIDPAVRALASEVDRTRAPGSYSLVYNGFELAGQARLPGGGQLMGGWTFEKSTEDRCQDERDRGDNPNLLRFCNENSYPVPYRNELKLSGSVPFSLPGVGDLNTGFAVLGSPGEGMAEVFRYSRSSSTNAETVYGAPFYTADTCVAPCVPDNRIIVRSAHPTVGTSTSSFDAFILPCRLEVGDVDDCADPRNGGGGSVKYFPALTQVDFNIAKVFNIGGWRYDARLEVFNLLNNDADRNHFGLTGQRGTSFGPQASRFERASLLIDARVYRFAVTARF